MNTILRCYGQLCSYHPVIALWVNSGMVFAFIVGSALNCFRVVQPKLGGGIREGNVRDPLTILWKQKVHKVLHYNPS